MKTTLLWVGKTTDRHLDDLIEDYRKRIGHYIPFEVKTIPALKNTKNMTFDQQKQSEGEQILSAVGQLAFVVLLDERGTERSSMEFARYIQKQQSASRDLVFVIGGPFGFSSDVYERANDKVSLSRMTFSHQMIRLLFTEQLYRALTILHGEKYHHE